MVTCYSTNCVTFPLQRSRCVELLCCEIETDCTISSHLLRLDVCWFKLKSHFHFLFQSLQPTNQSTEPTRLQPVPASLLAVSVPLPAALLAVSVPLPAALLSVSVPVPASLLAVSVPVCLSLQPYWLYLCLSLQPYCLYLCLSLQSYWPYLCGEKSGCTNIHGVHMSVLSCL